MGICTVLGDFEMYYSIQYSIIVDKLSLALAEVCQFTCVQLGAVD